MAQKSRPDPANGTIVTADEYEGLALGYVEDGVVGTPSDTAVVYADSTGRQVKVRAAKMAAVRGYQWWSDATTDEIINNAGAGLPANTGTNPRIDRLVLRLDRAARTIRTVYLQGTPAATPVAPALTQDLSLSSGLYDVPLARWQVAAGYTTVAAADIVTEAWYPQPTGPVLCTSTSRPFGASLYPGLEITETDTGLKYRWFSSQWQMSEWNNAWGTIGGRRWSSGGALANGVGASEGIINMDTGPITLIPGRSQGFAVRVSIGVTDTSANFFSFRIRQNSVTGGQAGDHIYSDNQTTFGRAVEFNIDLPDIGSTPVSATYVLTIQRIGGTGLANISKGTASSPTHFLVKDFGPITRVTAA